MSKSQAERNLLVGMIALQMELLTQGQLIQAFQAWTLDRDKPIEEILLEQSAINAEGKEFIAAIAAKFISMHEESVELSIASLSSIESLREKLALLDDDELEKTIQSVDRIKHERTEHHAQRVEATVAFTQGFESRRFKILRPHAKGGLGEVSVAEDLELNREVALKQIQARYRSDPESRSRFMTEAEITGKLEHPGIVPVYSLGTTEFGKPFYAMRFIHGDSLREAITKLYSPDRPKLTPEQYRMALRKLLRRFVDVCNAIEYAHSRGVLHRDLKPGNIMLGKYGETLVVDWGLAKSIGKADQYKERSDEPTVVPKSRDGSTHTQLGTIIGTLAYMSPEQASGQHQSLGPAADVYSLGATLFHLLTGRPPIAKGETAEMVKAIINGEIEPPTKINPLVPQSLSAICKKAMSNRPADRYPNAASLAEEVELWLADEPISAYREPLRDRIGRFIRRNQTLVTSTLIVLLLGTIGLIGFSYLISDRNARLQIANDAEREQRLKAEQAHAEAITRRDESLDLCLNVLLNAEVELKNVLGASRFRTRIMDLAYDSFDKWKGNTELTPVFLKHYATVARSSGNQRGRVKDFNVALERLKIANETMAELSDTPMLRDIHAETLRDLAATHRSLGQYDQAEIRYQESLNISEQLLSEYPESEDYQRNKAIASIGYAALLMEKLDLERGSEVISSAVGTFRRITAKEKVRDEDYMMACSALIYSSLIKIEQNDKTGAIALLEEALPLSLSWNKKLPKDVTVFNYCLKQASLLVEAKLEAGSLTEEDQNDFADITKRFKVVVGQSNATYDINFFDALRIQARIKESENKSDDAEKIYREAEEWAVKTLQIADIADCNEKAAKLFYNLSEFHRSKNDETASDQYRQRAKELAMKACSQLPESKRLAKLMSKILN